MQEDPQVALRTLVAALERHLDTCLSKRPGSDKEIEEAYDQVSDAFEKYEGLLEESFGEFLPIISEEE